MASLVYLLCAVTSGLCAALLWREYRRTRSRLLLWSSLTFGGFLITNALLFTDLVILPKIDRSLARAAVATASVAVLVYGLVWDED